MVTVTQEDAKLVDDCSECGQVENKEYMVEIEVGHDVIRLCPDHYAELLKQIVTLELLRLNERE